MKNNSKKKSDKQPTIQIKRNRTSGKKKPDLFAKFRNTEHPLDDIMPEQIAEITTPTTPATTPTISSNKTTHPVAPEKNYQKVTNSITRDAIPQRLFRTGKTKEIYDVLYGLTRGAINPRRSVLVSKPKLRLLTGVGSRVTIDTCLGYLEIVGLVKITTNHTGQHDGNEYEIFTPEEIGAIPEDSTGSSRGSSRGGSPAQTLGVVPRLVTRRGSQGSNLIKTGVIEQSKTSFKDIEKNDDEAFAGMIEVFTQISEKITGKFPHKQQRENWKQLAQILAMEFEIAAARTSSISNVPSFLTEHLRRRLLRKSETKIENKSFGKIVSHSSQVGKQVGEVNHKIEEFIAEPLNNQSRETVLKTMQEYIDKGQEEFVMSLRESYTKEDWGWLESNLLATREKNKGE